MAQGKHVEERSSALLPSVWIFRGMMIIYSLLPQKFSLCFLVEIAVNVGAGTIAENCATQTRQPFFLM